jgi:hypothetical protein
MSARLELIPVSFDEACDFVRRYHRRHDAPQGHKFSLGVGLAGASELVGVAIVGRPTSKALDNGRTLEITRVCVAEEAPNACSALYGAACRAGFALGYRKVITYIAKDEDGASARAAGFRIVAETPGRSWNVPSRPRLDKHALQKRLRLEREVAA